MSYLLAIFLPPLGFIAVGKPVQAILSLVLMITIIGWPIAAIWAVLVVHGDQADERNKRIERAIRETARSEPPAQPRGQPPSQPPEAGGPA